MRCTVRLLNGDVFESSAEPYRIALCIYEDYQSLYPDPPILFEQLSFSSESKGKILPYQLEDTDKEVFLMIRPLHHISYLNPSSRIELCRKALSSFQQGVKTEPNLCLYVWIDPNPLENTYYVSQLVLSDSLLYSQVGSYYVEKFLCDEQTVIITLLMDINMLPTESSQTVGVTYIFQQRLEWLKMNTNKS